MECFVLVTGASRGIGRSIAGELICQLIEINVCRIDVLLVARNNNLLSDTKLALEKSYNSFECELFISSLVCDISSLEETAGMMKSFCKMIENRKQSENHLSIFVISAAGKHEIAVFKDEEWRYSQKNDFSQEYVQEMENINVHSPILILDTIQTLKLDTRNTKIHYIYLSSQAANEKWWDKGNSIYGPQKHRTESILSTHCNNVILLCFRYPFVDSDMADELYSQLSKVEHLPPKADLFQPLSDTARYTVNSILSYYTNKNIPQFQRISDCTLNFIGNK